MYRDHEPIGGLESLAQTRLKAQARLASYLEDPREKVLREHQVDVMQDLQAFLESGNTAGYISLPTGSGKTVIITELARALGLKTLVLSPTKTILKQTEQTARRFSNGVTLSNYYSGERNSSGDVLNATYQSVPALLKEPDFKPEDVELVICDEAHTALGEERHKNFREFPNALMVGLTATPYFTPLEGYKTRGIVDPNERWTKMFTERIHEMSLEEGMERGVLTELDVHLVRTSVLVDNITINSLGEYRKSDLDKIFNIEARDALVVGMIGGVDKIPANVTLTADQIEEVKRIHEKIKGKKTAIFSLSVDHARTLSLKLNEHWIKASEVYGEMDDKVRESRIQSYESPYGQVLIGVDLLRLGWDSPQTEVGIYLAPTRSGITAVQELGRILRPSPETGKQRAIAIQLVDSYAQRGQSPVTITDIFDPEYVMRGTQKGLRPSERGEAKDRQRPVVTFEGMQLESIFEESRSNYLLRRRFRSADVMEMDQILDVILKDVQKRNANSTDIELYTHIAKEIPYFIGSKNQEDAVQAIASLDSNISEVGRRVITLINMKTILSVVELYDVDDPELKTELVHAGIANLLEGVATIKTGENTHATTYVHNLVRKGVAQHIATQEGMPLSWVLDRKHNEINKQLKVAFAKNPNGLTTDQGRALASSIHEVTELSEKALFDFISDRNSQLIGELGEEADENDLVAGVAQIELRKKIDEILSNFTPREIRIAEMRFGIRGEDTYTFREIGQKMGYSPAKVGQIEGGIMRTMRRSSISSQLKPYLRPGEYDQFLYQLQPQSEANPNRPRKVSQTSAPKEIVVVSGGKLVSSDRLLYRYPLVSIGYSGVSSDDERHIFFGGEIDDALEKANVRNLCDLLQRSEDAILRIPGINERELEYIKHVVGNFLESDARVVTIADKEAEGSFLSQTVVINDREINTAKLKYRYPRISVAGYYGSDIDLDPDLGSALWKGQVRFLDTLLMTSDSQLLSLPGIDEAGLAVIRSRVNLFLEKDAAVVTLADEVTGVKKPEGTAPTSVNESPKVVFSTLDPKVTIREAGNYLLDNGLSIRTFNALIRNGIKTVEEMAGLNESNIVELRNVGRKALEEVRVVIRKLASKEDN